jgi:poly(3-hydroxybutyrate) depolymerase
MPSAFAAMRQGAGGSRWNGPSGGPVATIVFHGDRDATVNPVNGDQVIAQVTTAADLRTSVSRGEAPGGLGFTRTVKTDASGRPMVEQWVLHGAGHAWSGGSPAGSYTEPRGPDASREMIHFFLQQPAAPRRAGKHQENPPAPMEGAHSSREAILRRAPTYPQLSGERY